MPHTGSRMSLPPSLLHIIGLPYGVGVLSTSSESPLVYACELWVFAMCPALRRSTGDAHFPKHNLEYSLNFWS